MKTFKILFSVVVIGLMALQPMQSSFAFESSNCKQELKSGEHGDYWTNSKNRTLGGCKPKCGAICNPEKRKINLDISIFKIVFPDKK